MASRRTRLKTLADMVVGNVAAADLLAPAQPPPAQKKESGRPRITFNSADDHRAYFEPLLLGEVRADMASTAERALRKASLELVLSGWTDLPAVDPKSSRRPDKDDIIRVTVTATKDCNAYGFVAELDTSEAVAQLFSEGDIAAAWHIADVSAPPGELIFPAGTVISVVDRCRPRTRLRMKRPPAIKSKPHKDSSRKESEFGPGSKTGKVDVIDLEAGEVDDDIIVISDSDSVEPGEIDPQDQEEWIIVRLGSLVTFQREHAALLRAAKSPLLPALLRPSVDLSIKVPSRNAQPVTIDRFVNIISKDKKLNLSQQSAVRTAAKLTAGFHVIQGPPGTGKTKTLMALINVVHATQYQAYYDSFLNNLEQDILNQTNPTNQTVPPGRDEDVALDRRLSKTLEYLPTRPRVLICAPSNAAVDEALNRMVTYAFVDGRAAKYTPEIARIGAGDRVSDFSKRFTAEAQAEKFIAHLTPKDDSTSHIAIRQKWQDYWSKTTNDRLHQLQGLIPTNQNKGRIVGLNEKLERLAREMKRFEIVCNHRMGPEEKVRRIARTYIQDAQIVFATLSGAASVVLPATASGPGLEELVFETTVIDEAAQATEPASLIPLGLGTHKCLLVGDPNQLPATVFSLGPAGVSYAQSLLERMVCTGKEVSLLSSQYRMHPAISNFPNQQFYDGKIVDDDAVQGVNRFKPYHVDDQSPRFGPYTFIDVECGSEERAPGDPSVFNRTEAILAVHLYLSIKQRHPRDNMFVKDQPSLGFGVITPYKKQTFLIRSLFRQAGVPGGDIEVDTVDAFQGREKDVIVFSCVRTDKNSGIGFIRDIRRMNVGLTRAKYSCIVLGNARALQADQTWNALITDARSRQCYIKLSSLSDWIDQTTPGWDLLPSDVKAARSHQYTRTPDLIHTPTESGLGGIRKKQRNMGNRRRRSPPRRVDFDAVRNHDSHAAHMRPPPHPLHGPDNHVFERAQPMNWGPPPAGPPMHAHPSAVHMNPSNMGYFVGPPVHSNPMGHQQMGPWQGTLQTPLVTQPSLALGGTQYPPIFLANQGAQSLGPVQPYPAAAMQYSLPQGPEVPLIQQANAVSASTGVPVEAVLASWLPSQPR